jgi:glycosyltransferase involved in cell wall biosynthesis
VRCVKGLRIAHLIETDGPGGAERVVVHLATALQEAGAWNVGFVPAGAEGWLSGQLARAGVTVETFRLPRPFSPSFARWLAQRLRGHRVDVAHSHEFTMAFYGAWSSWRARLPHVITMHGSAYYAARGRRRLALRAAIALSGRTVAVSADLARQLGRQLAVPARRIATIPNGVPPLAPAPPTLRAELQLRPEDRLLVSVGNLYPVKGHRHLVEALALIAERHPHAHVAVAGRGPEEAALSSLARERGVGARVHLLGLRSDIAAVLAAADVFVLPSLSEGLPLALLEAMFAGRPVVASDVGEVKAALAHGEAGVVVEPGDPAALARALDRLLSDPKRAHDLGASAARRAAADYDVSRMVGRYVETYAELLRLRRDARHPRAAASAAACGPVRADGEA